MKKPFRLTTLLLLLYWCTLFTATHVPSRNVPGHSVWRLDKLLHFSAYLVLSVLLAAALFRSRPARWSRVVCLFFVLAIYAMVDELLQHFVPSRHPDFYDWIADISGVLVGIYVFFILQRFIIRWRLSQSQVAATSPPGESHP